MKVIDHADPVEVEQKLWEGFGRHALGYDIGANCGQSIPMMLEFCDHVDSMEPNKDSFNELERRWGLDSRVDPLRIAVSDRDGTVILAQLPGKQAETGQLVTPGLAGMEWDPGDWSDVPEVWCWCRSIDSLAQDYGTPSFIKIDTEGHEAKILEGAPKTLEDGQTSWLIEFHSPSNYARCLELLTLHGHKTDTIRHPHYPEGSAMWHQHGWIKAYAPRPF